MKMFFLASAIVTLLLCSTATRAQLNAANREIQTGPSNKSLAETEAWRRRLWFSATLATSFDTNIDHDPQGVSSFGLVPSLGVHFQNSVERPSFEIDYEVAGHSYTNSDEWDRVSHNLLMSYRKHLFGRWSTRTESEITLKGSSEDRELNNQYTLRQQFEYRVNENTRLQLAGAYRVKRDPLDSGSNAIDPYVGARFIRKLAGDRRLALSYRYDKNRSWDPRNRYIRWAYGAEFATPIIDRRTRLNFDFTYKPRLYGRTVKVEGERVPRRDGRWIFETQFERVLRSDLRIVVVYRFEKRDSNDPDKDFQSHQAGVALTYRW
ncbi:MAG TPA: hypothetical protein VFZ22_10880 [Pyrinomonadaceae bacterium]|nr:hypothetical protein [Pyrinomonadaceae bacterium]